LHNNIKYVKIKILMHIFVGRTKMKKVFFILLFTSKIFAQETSQAESIPKTEEVILSEEKQEPKSEATQEVAPSVSEAPALESHSVKAVTYDDMLPLIINQLKIPGGEELLWEMTAPDYDQIKNNDFEYAKVKPEKIKEFKEIIASSAKKDFALNVFIEIGSYDFKKESYPIKMLGYTVNAFMSDYDVDLSKSGVMYSKLAQSKPMEDKGYISIFDWRILKTEKFKDLKIKKAEAEKLSAELGPNRKVHCVVAVSVPVFKANKEKFQPKKRLKAESTVKNMTCYSDSSRTIKIAELP